MRLPLFFLCLLYSLSRLLCVPSLISSSSVFPRSHLLLICLLPLSSPLHLPFICLSGEEIARVRDDILRQLVGDKERERTESEEKRKESKTEGGLSLAGDSKALSPSLPPLAVPASSSSQPSQVRAFPPPLLSPCLCLCACLAFIC